MRTRIPACPLLALVLGSACAIATPEEEADLVRPRPAQPLRVGLVVRETNESIAAGFEGGGTPADASYRLGEPYSLTLLPKSIATADLRRALVDLGTFTDLVELRVDTGGAVTRESFHERLANECWTLAQEQQLDAVLVVEGVRDAGLHYQDEESVFSLDTVLWWLTWPFGVLIPDRSYAPAVSLHADLFLMPLRPGVPAHEQAVPARVQSTPHEMKPWTRAATPALGFVLPPAWLADDRDAVTDDVRDWARATLPIALSRHLKDTTIADLRGLDVRFRRQGEHLEMNVTARTMRLSATVRLLPSGRINTDLPPAVPVAFDPHPSTWEDRFHHTGRIDAAALREDLPLLRAEFVLGGAQHVSMTWMYRSLPQ